MKQFLDYNYSEIKDVFTSLNQKGYKGQQVFEWVHTKRVFDVEKMTNLSAAEKEFVKNNFAIMPLVTKEIQESNSGTIKFLFELQDGELIETVLMKQQYGNSVCVTTQVGCNIGCKFCASGQLKKVRDLQAGEITAQILEIQKYLDQKNERVSHIVVMGIGEPFDNFENVKKFITVVNDPKGLAIGVRHITVSTSGIVPKIREFANWDTQVNLAISLHAANDKKRSQIMSINDAYNLADLISAIKYYCDKTNRRVTLEYILLNNVNDTIQDAKDLSRVAKQVHAHVNLIPFNAVEGSEFTKSEKTNVDKFFGELKGNNVNVTLRREFGSDIDAACGQLRSKRMVK